MRALLQAWVKGVPSQLSHTLEGLAEVQVPAEPPKILPVVVMKLDAPVTLGIVTADFPEMAVNKTA